MATSISKSIKEEGTAEENVILLTFKEIRNCQVFSVKPYLVLNHHPLLTVILKCYLKTQPAFDLLSYNNGIQYADLTAFHTQVS